MELGCHDNGCLFSDERGGMRTNGGCHCLDRTSLKHGEQTPIRRRILGLIGERSSIRTQLAQAQAELADIKFDNERRCDQNANFLRVRDKLQAENAKLLATLERVRTRMTALADEFHRFSGLNVASDKSAKSKAFWDAERRLRDELESAFADGGDSDV